MAIIRNAANTMMKGRVGQTTYYVSKGQQVARQSKNDSNYGETARRTELQQNRRVLWANLVQFYKISARWMPKAFESKKSGQTDYNKFMAVNVPSARIPLTRSEAEAGACVVDGFLVSQGSLPSVEVTQTTDQWKTNIMIGELVIGSGTTIAQLSAAMISNNANIREGMQLSYASYQQTVDPLGIPRVNCRLYELTVSTTDSSKVFDHIPDVGCSTVDGCIGTSTNVPTGGFAWILSELQSGVLKVSTQLLVTKNEVLIGQKTSALELKAAAESYGIDAEVILNPATTVSQGFEPTTYYIEYIEVDEQRYYPGDMFGRADKAYNKDITIHFNENMEGLVYSVSTVKGENVETIEQARVKSTTGNDVVVESPFLQSDGYTLMRISVTLTDRSYVSINFAKTSSSGDMG